MIHETSVRVRYGEVDRMGFVYHANYLPYFEIGRTEFLRGQGHAYRALEEAGTLLVVVDAGPAVPPARRATTTSCVSARA